MNDIGNLNPTRRIPDDMSTSLPSSQLSEFHLPDNNTIKKLIISMSSKTCSLDPMPTQVVKKHVHLPITVIGQIVRSPLSSGTFPILLRISHVKTKLKQHDLDKNLFSSYRPVSNIAFLSKVMEKIVANQMHTYL